MSTAGLRARICSILGLVVAYGCVRAPCGRGRSLAPEPCGLIKESEIAAAFGLAHAIKHNTLVTEPGNSIGSRARNRCAAFAWRGPKPTNEKRKRQRLLEGRLARLSIQSWAPDEGPKAKVWRDSFDETLKRVRGAASSLFLTQLRGSPASSRLPSGPSRRSASPLWWGAFAGCVGCGGAITRSPFWSSMPSRQGDSRRWRR